MNEEELSFHDKLVTIQTELKTPKSQLNKFGNYKYRSCEDILEAVKPLLSKYKLLLTLNDEMVLIGDRYYVKATVSLRENKAGFIEEITAYAREPQDRKGMDPSQITGAASSYARKYALAGLFLLDDNKDPDATNKHGLEPDEEDNPAEFKIGFGKFKDQKLKDIDEQELKDWCNWAVKSNKTDGPMKIVLAAVTLFFSDKQL